MMASAKRELKDTVDELPEADAELVLSFVHYLRSREGAHRARGLGEGEESPLGDWARDLLWILLLEGSETDLSSVRQHLEDRAHQGWLGLTEEVLARDWDRPEEDEAWSHL